MEIWVQTVSPSFIDEYYVTFYYHHRNFLFTTTTTTTMAPSLLLPPSPTTSESQHIPRESDDEDADTASQRSISLSSPSNSKRNSVTSDPRQSFATQSSGSNSDSYRASDPFTDESFDAFARRMRQGTPNSSTGPSVPEDEPRETKAFTYPPTPPNKDDAVSISSLASTSSRKARPESLLITPTSEPLVLGVALVDFNHLVRLILLLLPSRPVCLMEGRYRLDLALNTHAARFLKMRNSQRSFLSLLFQMVLIWYAPNFRSIPESNVNRVSKTTLISTS